MPYGPPAGAPQAQPYGYPYGQPPSRPQDRPQDQGQPSQGPPHAAPGGRRRVAWIASVTGVVVLLIAVIGVTGGFASDGNAPAQVPLGKTVDQTEFTTTVLGGSWGHEQIYGKIMVVRLRVTNTGDKPASLLDYLKTVVPLQAWGGGLLATDDTKAYTGGAETDQLTPGIATNVVAHYTPNTNERHSTRLTLRFCQIEHRSDFFYQGHQVWVPECDGWSVLDPRETVSPQDIEGGGLTADQRKQKAAEINRQGEAARKAKAFSYTGIVAQVNVPLKGGS